MLSDIKIVTGKVPVEKSLPDLASGLSAIPSDILKGGEFVIFPGFCDVHVHFREPGFSYKETIRTGTLAAAHGGYTAVCTMPNLNPVPDCEKSMSVQRAIIDKDAAVAVYPYAAITVGQRGEKLSDMAALAPYAVAYSDDGRGVQNEDMMGAAMIKAKALGKAIVAHCEADALLNGGYIHDGKYCKTHGHKGICSESEYLQIERDVRLAKETGCAYHVCHVSAAESVEIIRKAKSEGVNVTCETAPHYLVLDDGDLKESGDYKMNPPLRSAADRAALIDGVKDGTIDMIATDHAPHSEEEKSKGLKDSAFGIVGLETAFSVLYTELVRTGVITTEKLVDLLANNPRARFGIPYGGFSVWNLNESGRIDTDGFLSKGRSTPFAGRKVFGVNYMTVFRGKPVYVGK